MDTHVASAARVPVPMSVWAGFIVLAVGLGASVAVLGGFGRSSGCGTFGMDCVVAAFGTVLLTFCAALVLLLQGWRAMRHGGGRVGGRGPGPWFAFAKVLTMAVAVVLALAILALVGFAAMVWLR